MRYFFLVVALSIPSVALAQGNTRPSWLNAAPPVPNDPSAPLPEALQRVAEDIPNEGTPNPPEHYPTSNEWNHQLWFSHVRDLGGAFVGVGADQCYTLAAVQDARFVWLVDFDPLVPLIHRIYNVLVPLSETPDALIARFSDEQAEASTALLREHLANDPELEAIVRAFTRNRDRMHGYLVRVQRNVVGGQPASWLSDPMLYGRIRTLHTARRVVARNGDVTANGALRAVGRAAVQLGLPLRVIYFSNAEQFFPFTADFRANFDALPTDERSVVLRTFRERGAPYPRNERWHYMVQPVTDMRARIRENGYRHSRQIVMDLMHSRRALGQNGVSVVDASIRRSFDLTDDE
jgi:hypothetical protein